MIEKGHKKKEEKLVETPGEGAPSGGTVRSGRGRDESFLLVITLAIYCCICIISACICCMVSGVTSTVAGSAPPMTR